VVVLAWLLAGLLGALLISQPVVLADSHVTTALRAAASQAVLEALSWFSRLHGTAGILAMSALVAAWLAWRDKRALLPVLLASAPGGLLLNAAMKLAIARARPDVPYAMERLSTFSFPSGHTAGATCLYGFLVAMVWQHSSSPIARVCVIGIAISAITLVGASRVVLGLHYPSDCAAAVAEGILWLAICFGAARARRA
jgi:undecaprenyl-diphosphatase